jgi:hypothetical protein
VPEDGLRIADDLVLPLDLVVQKSAILARSGAGKTNTATVIVEEVLDAHQQVVILDPPGAWWGLRSSADGTAPGYAIVVLGGDHADLPLEATGGAVIADFVVDTGASVVLDLSAFSNREIAGFCTAFLERFYQRKATQRTPVLLVVEEADEVMPQRAMPEQTRMLGAAERIQKRGRMRGIGTLLITQRSASLNKNGLSQVELLIAMQTTAPHDIRALDEWVERTGDQEKRRQLLAEIAELPIGTAFLWSPAWLRIFRKAAIRRRRTFDSSATPKPGERRAAPKQLAGVDLAQLRERLAATVEKARLEDPALLRQRIRELEHDLARRPTEGKVETKIETKVERVEVPVLPPDFVAGLALVVQGLNGSLDQLRAHAEQLAAAVLEVKAAVDRALPAPAASGPAHGVKTLGTGASWHTPGSTARPVRESPPTTPASEEPSRVSGPQQRILDALASFEALGLREAERASVAVWSDASPTSSSYANNLGALRTAGLLDYPRGGSLALTDAGRAAAAPSVPIASVGQLHDRWCDRLSGPQGRILRALVARYPEPLDRTALAEEVGASVGSSSFANNLGALRSLGLLDYPRAGWVVATSLLFPDGVPL